MFGERPRRGVVGWIGVDVGAKSVKVAQVRRVGDRFELACAASTPRWNDPAAPANELRRREVETARRLAGALRGKHAAAVLSMRLCELRPTKTAEPPSPEEPVCVDRWATGADDGYELRAPLEEVESLCDGLGRAGLSCQAIDGQPLAVARALALADGQDAAQATPALVGGLDWGDSSATLVASTGGYARYARQLRAPGVGALVEAVGDAIGVGPDESDRLTRLYGLRGGEGAAGVVRQALQVAASPMIEELRRTLEHLEGKLRLPGPKRVYILGAGGAVPGLPEWLGERVGVTMLPWTPEAVDCRVLDESSPACLFAQAIALSTLAWEGAA